MAISYCMTGNLELRCADRTNQGIQGGITRGMLRDEGNIASSSVPMQVRGGRAHSRYAFRLRPPDRNACVGLGLHTCLSLQCRIRRWSCEVADWASCLRLGSGSLWAYKRSNAGGRQGGHEGTASYGDAGLLGQIQTG